MPMGVVMVIRMQFLALTMIETMLLMTGMGGETATVAAVGVFVVVVVVDDDDSDADNDTVTASTAAASDVERYWYEPWNSLTRRKPHAYYIHLTSLSLHKVNNYSVPETKWIALDMLPIEVAGQHASLIRISWNSAAPQAIVQFRNILTNTFGLAILGQRCCINFSQGNLILNKNFQCQCLFECLHSIF